MIKFLRFLDPDRSRSTSCQTATPADCDRPTTTGLLFGMPRSRVLRWRCIRLAKRVGRSFINSTA